MIFIVDLNRLIMSTLKLRKILNWAKMIW